MQFLVFKKGIKPVWEGQSKTAGRFRIDINKKYANKLWEDLILSYICKEGGDEKNYINGIRMNIKKELVCFQVWTKNSNERQN